MKTIRWGFMGTGLIAGLVATGLQSAPGAEIVAVGSRSQQTADRFGDRFGVPRRHGSYEALVHDPDVDVVYVATPHSLHCENTLLALKAGKPVLCEKPFAINAAQARQMIDCARERGLFLMEAMWARYTPAMGQVRKWLADGVIGPIKMLIADQGLHLPYNPEGRLFNPALGGGSLLDVTVYPVSLASMLLGRPDSITSKAHFGETHVDEQSTMLFGYDSGALAVLYGSIQVDTEVEAVIAGSRGTIHMHSPWLKCERLTLRLEGRAPQTFDLPVAGNGYTHEVVEVGECLVAGKLESAIMPLDETLSIMETMDRIREQWDFKYPME